MLEPIIDQTFKSHIKTRNKQTSLASSVTRKLLYTVGHKLCADLGAFARQRQTLGLRGVLLTDGDTENNKLTILLLLEGRGQLREET